VAFFQLTIIWRSARRLGMGTDSSYRFERGVDWSRLEDVLSAAAQRLAELAGGTPAKAPLFAQGQSPSRPEVKLRHQRLAALLGFDPGHQRSVEVLVALGFEMLEQGSESATFRVPAHRPDVALEADLIEEVLRIVGLDAVPTVLPAIRPQPPSTANLLFNRARHEAASCGLSEAVTYSFVSPSDL